MTADLAIRGGVVVTPEGSSRRDVHVAAGRIIDAEPGVRAHVEADASGLWVLPGMVDTHVHLMEPGDADREDYPTGTSAAAARGVTTIIEHTHSHPVRGPDELAAKIAHLTGRANVDYGLAAHVWPDRIDDMPATWGAGVAFFKMFTCTTHGVPGLDPSHVLRALRRLAQLGGTALVHCEDESITRDMEAELRGLGRSDFGVIPEWRSPEAELVAVAAVTRLAVATGTRVTIAHVSSPDVAGVIDAARRAGADLAAEACPQYFALRSHEIATAGPLRKFTPPVRAEDAADEDAMWRLVQTGSLTHFASDHAPSTRAQKAMGSIWDAPFGLPGLDTTLPFLIDAAVGGRITIEDVARIYSEYPARRYGLFPAKGHLAAGADADLVLVDRGGSWTVNDGEVISKAGWSPYSGRRFRGRIVSVYLRGRLVAQDGRPLDHRLGRFIPGPGARHPR